MSADRQRLELLARVAMENGTLARRRVTEFSGRFGAPREATCPVCLLPMAEESMTVSVPAEAGGLLIFHVSCFHAWQMMVPAEPSRAGVNGAG